MMKIQETCYLVETVQTMYHYTVGQLIANIALTLI
jgi:hypothetical protein